VETWILFSRMMVLVNSYGIVDVSPSWDDG